jgi:hypothetical protein
MKRLALLVPVAAAAAAVAVPTAGAGSFKGVVVKRDAARHTIAVASPSGVVRTVRTSRLRAAGTRVSVSAAKLADHTFRASRVTALGRTRAARVHGVVLRHLPARTLVSAGGSVLSIRTTARTFASASSMRPGTIVNARVRISRGALSAPRLLAAGQATVFEAEGTIASLSPLELTVEHGVTITLTVPAALQLPSSLSVGDRVEAIVQFDGTTYTLVTLTVEDQGQGNGGGVGEEQGRVEAEGTVTALTDTSITVQPSDDDGEQGSSPVTFAIPAGFDLHGVKKNDRVEAKGTMVNGVLTLSKLELKDEGQGDDNGGNGSGDDDHNGDGGGGDHGGDGGGGDGGSGGGGDG